jgi:DNA-binding NtrC family response regulator
LEVPVLKRPKIAILCTEMETVRLLATSMSRVVELMWSRDGKSLLDMVGESEDCTAAVIDIAAAPGNAIDVLQSVKRLRPAMKRVLVTDYCDLSIIVQGLHTSAVQSIVYKPIHIPELLGALGIQNLPMMPAVPVQHGGRQVRRAAS